MFKISKKNLILLILLIVALVIIFYWQNIKEIVVPGGEEVKIPGGETELSAGESRQPTPTASETENEESKISREEFIDYVSKNISSLSPEKPVLGGKWYVTRFWFVKDAAAYVEYEDGHILRQILVEAKEIDGEIDYKVIGYFEGGANEWILKSGEDPYYGRLKELYEWDDISKSWRKR